MANSKFISGSKEHKKIIKRVVRRAKVLLEMQNIDILICFLISYYYYLD